MSKAHSSRTGSLGNLIRSALTSLKRVTGILKQAGSRLAVLVLLLTVLEAMLSIFSLYAIKLLVDAISANMAEGGDRLAIYQMLALAGGSILAASIAQSSANLARTKQGMLVSDVVNRQLHAKSVGLDLAFFESPRYHDTLQRARQAGPQRPAQVISNVIAIGRGTIMLGGIFVLLAAIEWRLLPVLLLTVGLALAVRLYFTRKLFAWRMRRAQMERKAGYLDWMLTSNVHATEMRLNRLGPLFIDTYSRLRQTIRGEHIAIERGRLLAELAVGAAGVIVFLGAGAFLITRALDGALTLGEVVLFVLLLRRAEGAGNEVVSAISRLVDDHLFLERLFAFMDIEPTIERAPATASAPAYTLLPAVKQGVVLQNVSFTYEGSHTPSLQGVNLTLETGRITALVGANGSGKTTLIKLLTRLYDPTEGRILLDGTDIRAFDPLEYRKLFSVILQAFATYPESIAENIRFGDPEATEARARIVDAARRAGAEEFIKALPRGFDTPLTKLFDDGHDLSLGQWQRVALSRAFFPHSRFVIMDEPTSAVDPVAEADLFDDFRNRLGERAALIISHRLSTVRQADYTYVLDGGRILEHGTHDDLVARDGPYANLFIRQARGYQ